MNIVFQGDSATDSGRDRSCYNDLGEGYPNYAAAMIQDCFGDDCDFEFYNFACDGNSIRDLNDSLNDDFVEIKPDIVSVMIGVDDILSSEYITRREYRVLLEDYIQSVKDKVGAAVMVIQPYIQDVQELSEDELEKYKTVREVIELVAQKCADAYLPLPPRHIPIPNDDEEEDEYDEELMLSDDASYIVGELYLEAVSPIIENIIAQEK